MKKLILLNLSGSIAGTFLILMWMLGGGTALTQTSNDLDREILVYIQPSILEFPVGERDAVLVERLTIPSQELRQAFNRFGIDKLAKAIPDFNEADTIRVSEDGRLVSVPRFSRIFRIQVSDKSKIDSVIAVLSRVPGILFAEKNMDAKLLSDPTYINQWHLNNTGQCNGTPGADIKAEQAWGIFTGSSSIKIGIFDSGVETSHTEFSGKISGDARDALGSDPWWSHGTHVAGIAAAKANNDAGGRGVDWNVQINSRKIFNGYGTYLGDATVSSQITNAVNSGVNVLNNSWSSLTNSTTVRLAFAYAYKMNRVSVAAMGNNGSSLINYPAAFGQGIIAVGATQNNDTKSPFSNRGNHIDVTAPGGYNLWPSNDCQEIWSTWRGNSYRYLAGTSMATPQVSGIASLLKGYNSSLYNDDIENIIKLSAEDVNSTTYPGWDQYLGYGRVNVLKALRRLRGPYTLTQPFVVGGTDQGASDLYQMTIYGAQALDLQDGTYDVKRHEVRQTVTYPTTRNVVVWGRGAATNGWANEGTVNYTYGFCEPVAGTVTSTSATLRTFVYEVFWSDFFLGWYPTPACSVRFEYTVHGIPATIASNTAWEGEFDLDGSVTVNSGITLTISPGTSISFASGASLNVNGDLTAEGTSDAHIIFTRADTSSSSRTYWNSIYLTNGSTCSFDYIDMYGAQYGIYLNNTTGTVKRSYFDSNGWALRFQYADDACIENCQFSDNNCAMYIQYSDDVDITDNYIENSNYYGLYIYGSAAELTRNTVDGTITNDGIRLIGSDLVMMYYNTHYDTEVNNTISDNNRYGIYISSSSTANLGVYAYGGGGLYQGGFNNFVHGSGTYDAYNASSNTIKAELNWWDDQTLYGSFDTSPTAEDYGFQLPKATGTSGSSQVYQLIAEAQKLEYVDSTYTEAIDILKQAADLASDDSIAYCILHGLARLYNKIDDKQGLLESLDQLYATYNDQLMGKIALDYSVKVCAGLGYLDEALKRCDKVIGIWSAEPNSQEALASALFHQGILYLYMDTSGKLGKSASENATKNFYNIINNYPDTEVAWLVAELFGLEKSIDSEKTTLPEVYALHQNYPNPFNPSTTICFDLPEPAKVSLVIYDVLGREVWSCNRTDYSTGRHSIIWNGTNNYGSSVATGMYIIQMITPKFMEMQKILLIQ